MEENQELKRRNECISRSLRKWEQLAGNLYEVFYSLDPGGIITYVSPSVKGFAGFRPEDITGRRYTDFVHPEDRSAWQGELEKILSGDPRAADLRLAAGDGGYIWTRTRAEPVFKQGRVVEIHGAALDITGQKKELDRERILVEELDDLIWTFDLCGMKFTFCSKSIEKLLGYSPEEAENFSLDDLFSEETKKKVLRAFSSLLKGRDSSDRVLLEAEHKRRDGSFVWMEINAVLHRDESGGPALLSGVTRDISERKRIEEEKDRLNERLRQAGKMEALARMAGAVAHHFNNQMSVIMGNLELALDEIQPYSEAASYLKNSLSGCLHASHISSQLLSYLGQSRGKERSLELSRVCRRHLQGLEEIVPESVQLYTEFEVPGPVVSANEDDLKQAVTVLLLNACEACSVPPCIVRVRTKTAGVSEIGKCCIYPADWEPLDENYACLAVSDTGCGISSKNMEKIFDPFFTTKSTGRGLGLAVVLGMVKAKNGAIGVESGPEQGSVIRVFLPLSEEALVKSLEKTPENFGSGAVRTVLLVDDRLDVRKTAEELLEHLGYRAVPASGGHEALELMRQETEQVDCVITDLSMPGMDGWDTMFALKEICPHIPVILASGYDKVHALKPGKGRLPDAFLQKPFQMSDLKSVLGKILT